MKKTIQRFTLFALSFTLLMACKTRHVLTTRTDSSTKVDATSVLKTVMVSVDTGKTHTQISSSTNLTDSAQVTILPDPGSAIRILLAPNQSFTFTGKAKSVIYKNQKLDDFVVDKQIQTNHAQITRSLIADSNVTKTLTHTSTQTKALTSKSNMNIWLWIIMITILLAAIGMMLLKVLRLKP